MSAGFFFLRIASSATLSSCCRINSATFSAVSVEIGMPTRYSKSLTAVFVAAAADAPAPSSSSSSSSSSFSSSSSPSPLSSAPASPFSSEMALKPFFLSSCARSVIFLLLITIWPLMTICTKRALALSTSVSRVRRATRNAFRLSYMPIRTSAKSRSTSSAESYFLIFPSASKSIMLFRLMELLSFRAFSSLSSLLAFSARLLPSGLSKSSK
mmetsp:Transcript_9591/g.17197  ORF Transcript_9591/g.17197 Transcript_9591/m.17197 type:complete len:212 (-) Transcript_9591:2864-3499(-)